MSTENIFESFQSVTEHFLNRIADVVAGKASTLRDGTEYRGVELPRDLYAHPEVQTEWWYYTGHLVTDTGGALGFEFVFFKRRTDLDKFGIVPLRLIANPLYLAHFAITDEESGQFRYDHRKSASGPFEFTARASQNSYYLRLGDWTVQEQQNGQHLLKATLGDDLILELRLKSTKPPVLNGHAGEGVSFKDQGEASRYFSLTRMRTEGAITWKGKTERVRGESWMDREFGTWRTTSNQKGWDWFSLQLHNGSEVMLYNLRNSKGMRTSFSSGSYVDIEGHSFHLLHSDFSISALEYWISPRSGARYPIKWRVRVPRFGLDLMIKPIIEDQELDTRGTTMIVYWEGACKVFGRHGNEEARGRAYAELVGYDLSHERPSLSTFVFGNSLERSWRSIFG